MRSDEMRHIHIWYIRDTRDTTCLRRPTTNRFSTTSLSLVRPALNATLRPREESLRHGRLRSPSPCFTQRRWLSLFSSGCGTAALLASSDGVITFHQQTALGLQPKGNLLRSPDKLRCFFCFLNIYLLESLRRDPRNLGAYASGGTPGILMLRRPSDLRQHFHKEAESNLILWNGVHTLQWVT